MWLSFLISRVCGMLAPEIEAEEDSDMPMNFLKRLLGGGGAGGDQDGVYFYVRVKRTGEVIRLRLHRFNDLSMSDDGESYYVRKLIVGQRSFDRIEAEFSFDKNRRFVAAEITGGELVDQADYEQYMAEHQSA